MIDVYYHIPIDLLRENSLPLLLGVPDASPVATVCLATAVDQMLRRWCAGSCFT